jgi:O-succinylhomoserine sulfhydrylase
MSDSAKTENKIPIAKLDGAAMETLAIRAGQIRSHQLEHSEAIFPTSSFVFNTAKEAAERFSGSAPGNIYARFTNPTVTMFEQRLASMEGAERAVATASGMAAIMSVCFALLEQGDHIICSRSVFGTTNVLLEKYVRKFGVEISFVELSNYESWSQALKPNTRFLFLETPSNPLCEVVDLVRLADIAHSGVHPKGTLLVVDNCLCTPVLQQPLALGADLIVHSATKYIDGQGRCLGGAVAGNADIIEEVHGFLRSGGPSLSPFNAWILLKGLETLSLRMYAHSASALKVAQWLEQQEGIEQVYYSGLTSHPHFELAQKQQKAGSGVLSFKLNGNKEAAWRFIDALGFISITANLGDTKSTITHPATTTHGRLTEDDRQKSGITENLIRVSVGLENVDDIISDLAKGLAATYK